MTSKSRNEDNPVFPANQFIRFVVANFCSSQKLSLKKVIYLTNGVTPCISPRLVFTMKTRESCLRSRLRPRALGERAKRGRACRLSVRLPRRKSGLWVSTPSIFSRSIYFFRNSITDGALNAD
ncbi:hypothetical protein TNCV_182301 [Trichonephila clavipes]|nr:hypothetical protein TNCV_182301 [Trichonephila clavipes]